MPIPKQPFEPDREGPLRGVRVLDFSRLVAGNMLSLQLADFGAEVVKVESPGRGDTLRDWREAGVSVHWKVYARNKKSITLDLKAPEAPGIILDLVPHFDVMIESFRFRYLERLGVGARYSPRAQSQARPRAGVGLRADRAVREASGLRHPRRGHVGLRLAQRVRRSRARAAAPRHGRHDRGTLRRHGHGDRGAQRRGERRPRPGHRPEPARIDLLDPRPRGRHLQALAQGAQARGQRLRSARRPATCTPRATGAGSPSPPRPRP